MLRFFLFIFLLFFVHVIKANTSWLKQRVDRLDSLMTMYYSNYNQAEKEANELYNLFNKKYTEVVYKELKIRVMLQKATLFSLNGNHHQALQIALAALDEAEEYKLPKQIYHSCWIIAIMYEIAKDYEQCKKYLNIAHEIHLKYNLDSVFSAYCIRMASYYNRMNQLDSAVYFAYQGLNYAKKYHNVREERDAYLLLGSSLPETKYREKVKYRSLAAQKFIEIKDFTSAASQLSNAAELLFAHQHLAEAFLFSDSAFSILNRTHAYVNPHVYETRSILFEAAENRDSAYYFFKQYHSAYLKESKKMETAEIKKISEQYQNDKKEAILNSKNLQIILIICILTVVAGGSIILFRKNKKIHSQNRIIHKQIEKLTKTLAQKQVLLSELQHRVKNNLQHVISILEIQKESIDFNNIDEVIRSNQNRIHSMALLHKKLNVFENANEVELPKYIAELSALIMNSYHNAKKPIQIQVSCSIKTMTLETALPLGLIIVELISNSMKHAFINRDNGMIHIKLAAVSGMKKNTLYYADNGIGYNFSAAYSKGLGAEIIKGLIDQLNADVVTNQDNGFKITLLFNE